ncbi:polyprotein [Diplocarpon rosae]|nr:polyprotein [Diplocarpon rosae]
MAFKAINNTTGPGGIVLMLLINSIYPRLSDYDTLSLSVTKRQKTRLTLAGENGLAYISLLQEIAILASRFAANIAEFHNHKELYMTEDDIAIIFLIHKEKADFELSLKL